MRERAEVIRDAQAVARSGFAEYAREGSVFAHFDRAGLRLGLNREQVLLVHLVKHMDLIHAWRNGHQSQREPIYGRFLDAIVYSAIRVMMRYPDSGSGLEGLLDTIDAEGRHTDPSHVHASCRDLWREDDVFTGLPTLFMCSLITAAAEVES